MDASPSPGTCLLLQCVFSATTRSLRKAQVSCVALPWLLGLELAHPCLLPLPVQEDTHFTRCKASATELPPWALFLVTF